MTTETAPVVTLEDRVAALEEILAELGHFSLLSIGGKHLKLTGAAVSALAKLGEVEQQRVRARLAADSRPWFSSIMIRALGTAPSSEPASLIREAQCARCGARADD